MSILHNNGLAVLRNRNLSFFLSAKFLATLAVQMQGLAVGWQVYAMTGNVMDLGWIGLAQFAPFFLLVLVAGHIADRYDRRKIVSLCFALETLCSGVLLWYTRHGGHAVWPIFALLALHGVARAFMMPTSQAMVINLVPKELFGKAVALNSSSFHVAVIAGPMLGGLLYGLGPATVYAWVAGLLAVATLLSCAVRLHGQVLQREPTSWHTLVQGLRFVWVRKPVLGAISLDLFAVLFGGSVAVLPAIAHDVMHVGPLGLGLMRTAPGVGAALTAVALTFLPISRQVGRWMFGGVAVFGVATVVFGLSTSLLLSLACLLCMGAGDMVSVYIRHILVQLETPDAIRGRVSAVNSVFIGASNELGEFESGLAAAWLGLIPSVVVGGAATLLVAGLWMAWFPMLRTLNRFPQEQARLESA